MVYTKPMIVNGNGSNKTEFHYGKLSDGFPINSHPLHRPGWLVKIFYDIPIEIDEFRKLCADKHVYYSRRTREVENKFKGIMKAILKKHKGTLDKIDKETSEKIKEIVTNEKYVSDSLNTMKKNSEVEGQVTYEHRFEVARAIHDAKWYLRGMKKELESLE
jgi:hypothetical protein